jgi:hypothetical protein
MFGNRIKIDGELFEKVKLCAEKAGYASTEEFIAHVLEQAAAQILGQDGRDPDEEVKRRLQGLGYIE